ncbi:MAG: molybdopterin-synthase adenylyltransferase MoeB [Acidimicrobiia bacterium]
MTFDPGGYEALVAEARAAITEITVEDLAARLGQSLLLVDVREPGEVASGIIPGARAVPMGSLLSDIPSTGLRADSNIVVYCTVGARSALVAKALAEAGFTSVASLAGGIARWRTLGHPVEIAGDLSPEQAERYSRHLVLSEVGADGQQALLQSRVLLVGAGGLGSPAALYLAAAGVGTLGIVDGDRIEVSNLQRQVIHATPRVGDSKVDSARLAVTALNPDVSVQTHDEDLEAANALTLMAGYDVIVDATDNFPTRYLINDASMHLRTPVVHASVHRFEGQLSVFHPYRGPCYRCLFPQPPPPELAPSCAQAGVLGVLPGVLGSLQATEVLKLLLGAGEPLVGRLLTYDALQQEFLIFRIDRNPQCPTCSDDAHAPQLVDYNAACRPA